jgi:long-chain acyl-CoA synthetase
MPDLQHWAAATPDTLAIAAGSGATRTFAELDANANRLARALRRRGVGPGDAVAVIAINGPAFVETVAAMQRAGFRLTPVNWHLTADEAAYIVDDCEAKAMIATSDVAAMAAASRRAAPACTVALVAGGEAEGFERYEAVLDAEPSDPIDDPVPGSLMMYTSGTTGRPKGVEWPPTEPTAGAEWGTTRAAATCISAPARCTTAHRWPSRSWSRCGSAPPSC